MSDTSPIEHAAPEALPKSEPDAGFRDLTADPAQGRPSPQRVKASVMLDGTPALRILPDASERAGFRPQLIASVAVIVAGGAVLLYTHMPAFTILGIGLMAAGYGWYLYLAWRVEGIVTVKAHPIRLLVTWRSGWWRRTKEIDRRFVTAVQVRPVKTGFFPPAMSSTGELASVVIIENGEVRPVAYLRKRTAVATGRWLAKELAEPLEVIEPDPHPFPLTPMQIQQILGPGYSEVPLPMDVPGMPQPVWRREDSGIVQYALPMPDDKADTSTQVLGAIAGVFTSSIMPFVLGGDWTALLFGLLTLAVVVAGIWLMKYWKERQGKPPEMRVTLLTIGPTGLYLTRHEDRKSGKRLFVNALSVRLTDTQTQWNFRPAPKRAKNTLDDSVTLVFEGSAFPKNSIPPLHPVTAEALAAAISRDMDIPTVDERG